VHPASSLFVVEEHPDRAATTDSVPPMVKLPRRGDIEAAG